MKNIFDTLAEPKKEVQIAASMALVQVGIMTPNKMCSIYFMANHEVRFLCWAGVRLCGLYIKRYGERCAEIFEEFKFQRKCLPGCWRVLFRKRNCPWSYEGLFTCTSIPKKLLVHISNTFEKE